jgi:hypothetical protein
MSIILQGVAPSPVAFINFVRTAAVSAVADLAAIIIARPTSRLALSSPPNFQHHQKPPNRRPLPSLSCGWRLPVIFLMPTSILEL